MRLIPLAFFLALAGCAPLRAQQLRVPDIMTYTGSFGTLRNGAITDPRPVQCSVAVSQNPDGFAGIATAIRNLDSVPVKSNLFSDSLNMITDSGKIFEIPISRSTRGSVFYYHSQPINPDNMVVVGNLAVQDAGILNAISSGDKLAFVWKLGLTGDVCLAKDATMVKGFDITQNQAENLVANVQRMAQS